MSGEAVYENNTNRGALNQLGVTERLRRCKNGCSLYRSILWLEKSLQAVLEISRCGVGLWDIDISILSLEFPPEAEAKSHGEDAS